jgi:hypothetical protein
MVDDDDKEDDEVPSVADSSPPDSDSVPPDAPTQVQELPEALREQMIKAGMLPPSGGKGHVIPPAPPVPRIPGVGGPVARPGPPKPPAPRPGPSAPSAVASNASASAAASAAEPITSTSQVAIEATPAPAESGVDPDSADTSGVERVVGPGSSGEKPRYAPPTAHLSSGAENLAATVVGTQPIPLLTAEQAALQLANAAVSPSAPAIPNAPLGPNPPALPSPGVVADLADVPPPPQMPPELAPTVAPNIVPDVALQLHGPSRVHYPPPVYDAPFPGTAEASAVSGIRWAIGGIIVGLVLLGILIALIVVLVQKL